MTKEKHEPKSADEVYTSIQVGDDVSRPMSFRADKELYKKIKTLEKVGKGGISQVLKNAVEMSFNTMIFSSINNQIYALLESIFKKVDVSSTAFTIAGEREEGEKTPFVKPSDTARCTSTVKYGLPYPTYEDKDQCVYSLDVLQVEITTEGSSFLKLKVSLGNVIDGKSGQINPNLYLKLAQIVGTTNFKTEMNPSKKDNISTDITFERHVGFDFTQWSSKCKDELLGFKKMMDEINKLFSENKELKEKPVKK